MSPIFVELFIRLAKFVKNNVYIRGLNQDMNLAFPYTAFYFNIIVVNQGVHSHFYLQIIHDITKTTETRSGSMTYSPHIKALDLPQININDVPQKSIIEIEKE